MGVVMVLVALAMAGELDIRFQNEIAATLPAVLVNPSKALEESAAARSGSRTCAGAGGGTIASASAAAAGTGGSPCSGPRRRSPGTQSWFNTPGGRPLSLASLRGRVVLIDFWTYSCINCIRDAARSEVLGPPRTGMPA